jgi:peptidoglycan/LPS O-acetylase OafA/YrhL
MPNTHTDSLLRSNHLTPVRWVLALMVMLGHAWFVTTGYEPFRLHDWTASYMAVNGFFILSGMLIAKSLTLGRSKVNYTKARLLRIMPGLAFVLLGYLFIIAPFFTISSGEPLTSADHLKYVVKTLLMADPFATPGVVFPENPLHYFNGALWTIRFEILAYAMAAGLIWTGIVRSAATAIGIWFGLTISYYLAPVFIDHGGLLSALRLCSAFAMGMVLWYVPALRKPGWIYVGFLSVAFLAFGWTQFGEFLANFALAAIILKFGLPEKASPIALKLPDWSYGIYLWHYPVMQVLLALNPDLGPERVLFHALPITLAISMISWTLIEKPALALKNWKLPLMFAKRSEL